MKFLKSIVLAGLLVLSGCQSKEPQTPVQVLVPQGATAMALLPLYDTNTNVETVAGSDVISAELVKTDSKYDLIVAPINLGAKLLEKGNSEYRMQAVITWGNLYIVGTQEEGNYAVFGEGAVPEKILTLTMPDTQGTFYNSAQDVQAQLLSGQAQNGLLAEPAATATIAKAKEQGIELSVKKNLQEAYNELYPSSTSGYPQAAIFVKKGSEDKVKDVLTAIESFDNETAVNTPDEITKIIDEKALTEKIGVPSSAIAQKTWTRQNIKYVNAIDAQEEITNFLKLFNITYSDEMLTNQ